MMLRLSDNWAFVGVRRAAHVCNIEGRRDIMPEGRRGLQSASGVWGVGGCGPSKKLAELRKRGAPLCSW